MFVEGMFVVARDRAAFSTVIVRLDSTIQYSGTPMTDQRGRGVLDTRLRGYDSGFWAPAFAPSLREAKRRSNPVFVLRHDGLLRWRSQ